MVDMLLNVFMILVTLTIIIFCIARINRRIKDAVELRASVEAIVDSIFTPYS